MELTATQLVMAAFIVSALLNVVMMFRVYNAVPRELVEAMIDFGERRAEETPSTWDDEAIDLLRKIFGAIVPNTKPDTGASEPPELG